MDALISAAGVSAFGWRVLAASSLLVGALIVMSRPVRQRTLGLIMAFGAGVLISAVAGIAMLERLLDDLDASGVRLLFARVRTSVRDLWPERGSRSGSARRTFHLTALEAGRAYAARHEGQAIAAEDQ